MSSQKNYSTDYDQFLKEELQNLEGDKKKQQDAVNAMHDSQLKFVKDDYGKAIDDANIAYENEYERNAVQKLINEKQIAERNANLGLNDSGLNRTQQTAAQLSYANQKGSIDLARQNNINNLSQNLTSAVAEIEQSRIASLANLEKGISDQARDNAISRYNAKVAANAKMYEAQQNALSKQSATFTEFNKISQEIDDILSKKKNRWYHDGWVKDTYSYMKAANKLYTYYASGYINDLQAQELIRTYGLEEYVSKLGV